MCSRICKHNYRITIIVKIGYRDNSPAGLVVTGVPLARDDMHSPRATVKHTPCLLMKIATEGPFRYAGTHIHQNAPNFSGGASIYSRTPLAYACNCNILFLHENSHFLLKIMSKYTPKHIIVKMFSRKLPQSKRITNILFFLYKK